jgi:hypothetical protein
MSARRLSFLRVSTEGCEVILEAALSVVVIRWCHCSQPPHACEILDYSAWRVSAGARWALWVPARHILGCYRPAARLALDLDAQRNLCTMLSGRRAACVDPLVFLCCCCLEQRAEVEDVFASHHCAKSQVARYGRHAPFVH